MTKNKNKNNYISLNISLSGMKTIVILLTIILLTTMVNASLESLPAQKQYSSVILWQSCDNSTYSNITSVKSGATTLIGLTAMTEKSDNYYEHSFTNTSSLGTYVVTGNCNENGADIVWAYDFEVTGDGQRFNAGTTFFLIMLCLSIVILILSFIFHNYIFAFISGLSFSITGVYSLIYGFTSIMSVYTRMVSFIILGLGLIIMIVSSLDLISELSPEEFNYSEEDND